jgi:hypothetical protein
MISKKDKIGLWLTVMMPVLCIGVFLVLALWVHKGPKYDISSECVQVKGGGYHATIPVADIVSDSVWEHWPGIALRTNGVSIPGVNMGHFRLKNGENCMMFIHKKGGSLLELRTVDGGLYYLNCATEEETLKMIDEVKEAINAKHTVALRHCEERSNPDKKPIPWIASSCLLAMTVSFDNNIDL